MVYKLRTLLSLLDRSFYSGGSLISFKASAPKQKSKPLRGPIKNRWLNLIVHHTRRDRMFSAFGKDPTI